MKKRNWKLIVPAILFTVAVILILASKPWEINEPEYYEKYGFQPTVVIDGDWTPTDLEWYDMLGQDERIMVKGSAHLRESLFVVIPEYLWVDDNLYVNSATKRIPDTIHVGDKLFLQGSRVKTLPTSLDAGEVNLNGTEVEELPEGFRLEEGCLTLGDSKVTSIPDGWAIRDIDARNSQLEYIGEHNYYYDTGTPKTMGIMYLNGSNVRRLPKNLHLIALSIGSAPIEALPEGLVLEEGLDLTGTCVRELSARTEIHETLDLTGTAITKLPPDIDIHSRLIITDTAIEIEDVPEGAVWTGDIVKE